MNLSPLSIILYWMLALETGVFTQISKQAQPTIKTHRLKVGQSLN